MGFASPKKPKTKIKNTMKIINKIALLAVAGVLGSGLAAKAQDTTWNNGDIILGFRAAPSSPGAGSIFMVNLGSAVSYKDTTTNITNIANLNTQLDTLFGSGVGGGNWYERADLFAGFISANNGTSSDNNSANTTIPTQNTSTGSGNEFNSTIYISSVRTAPGTVGASSSSRPGIPTQLAPAPAAALMVNVGATLDSNDSNTGLATVASGGFSNWDSAGNAGNGADFGLTEIEASFGGANLGTFGGIANVEQYWDLYRVARWGTFNAPFQLNDADSGRGFFQGTFTLSQNGGVAFVVIPEPSTYTLLALGLGVVIIATRRRNKLAA